VPRGPFLETRSRSRDSIARVDKIPLPFLGIAKIPLLFGTRYDCRSKFLHGWTSAISKARNFEQLVLLIKVREGSGGGRRYIYIKLITGV